MQETLTASDNCSGVEITTSTDPYTVDNCNGYTVVYRWTATDSCGNSSEVTQSFNVLPDTEAPVFDSAPSSLSDINCDGTFPGIESLTASDNCSGVEVTTSTDPYTVDNCNGYTVVYRWTATDSCGNSSEVTQSFNVLPDTDAPTFLIVLLRVYLISIVMELSRRKKP